VLLEPFMACCSCGDIDDLLMRGVKLPYKLTKNMLHGTHGC
jgi:hypothetical protein